MQGITGLQLTQISGQRRAVVLVQGLQAQPVVTGPTTMSI
jgi:hypothetical protein